MSAQSAGLDSTNRFSWDWSLSEVKQDKPVKVFSCFACGGGSCMGYKRAGFEVLGCVEIDPAINEMYRKNLNPKYNFLMDLREFNKLEDIPEELIGVDILDGSPPCTTFSSAGKREETWGKEKVFREGQAKQTLMVIICGHTRRMAALMLGLDEVPVIVADDLTDEQIRAYRLADNRVAELAEWDEQLLKEELAKIKGVDLSGLGFDREMLQGVQMETLGIKRHVCPRCGAEWSS